MEPSNTKTEKVRETRSTIYNRRNVPIKEDVTYVVHTRVHLHTLEWNHFICVGFIWSSSLLFITNTVHLNLRYGLPPVLLAYFAISVVFGIPLIMVYLFFGSYIRKGYMQLWEMVPILKGVSWSTSLLSITVELFNVTLTGIALLYILKLFSFNVPWENCDFEGASKLCQPMEKSVPSTKACCTYNNKTCSKKLQENYVHSPAIEYFYNIIIKISADTDNVDKIQVPMLLAVFFIWFLIFLLMVCEFQKFIGFITSIFTILATFFIVTSIGLLIFIGENFTSFSVSNSDTGVFLSDDFWTDIIIHCALNTIPGNFVMLGAMAPHKIVPILQSVKFFIMQYIFMILFSSWLSISIQMLSKYYQVADIKCIKVDGILFLFAIIPDLLAHLPLSHLFLFIWFFSIWLLGFSSSLCTMSAFLVSLEQISPKISHVRIYFCAILCIILFSINVFLLTNSFLLTFETWNLIVFRHVPTILIFIFSIGLLLYSVRKLNNDYYFIYGKPLLAYWTQSYKLILLISFFCVTFGLLLNPVKRYLDPEAKLFFPELYIIIILMPIFIIAIVTYMVFKNENKDMLAVTATPKWGPPSFIKKQSRIKFNPDKNTYLNDMDNTCLHNCLLNSDTFKKEIKLLSLNCSHLTDSYFEEMLK